MTEKAKFSQYRESSIQKRVTRNQYPVHMKETLQIDSYQKAMNSALRILTRRDHTVFELSQKLKLRNFGEDIIRRVLSECERLHYLDDDRTALIFLNQLKRKGYGSLRIRNEFRKKGLRGAKFEKIITNGCSDDDDRVNAKQVLLKKMNSFDRETDEHKRRGKMYRFLNSRGFPDAIISELLRKYA